MYLSCSRLRIGNLLNFHSVIWTYSNVVRSIWKLNSECPIYINATGGNAASFIQAASFHVSFRVRRTVYISFLSQSIHLSLVSLFIYLFIHHHGFHPLADLCFFILNCKTVTKLIPVSNLTAIIAKFRIKIYVVFSRCILTFQQIGNQISV